MSLTGYNPWDCKRAEHDLATEHTSSSSLLQMTLKPVFVFWLCLKFGLICKHHKIILSQMAYISFCSPCVKSKCVLNKTFYWSQPQLPTLSEEMIPDLCLPQWYLRLSGRLTRSAQEMETEKISIWKDTWQKCHSVQFSSVQSLSHAWFFATP